MAPRKSSRPGSCGTRGSRFAPVATTHARAAKVPPGDSAIHPPASAGEMRNVDSRPDVEVEPAGIGDEVVGDFRARRERASRRQRKKGRDEERRGVWSRRDS